MDRRRLYLLLHPDSPDRAPRLFRVAHHVLIAVGIAAMLADTVPFVAAEYDDGPVHQAVVMQGIVEIVSPQNFWEKNQRLLIGGAVALVVLWLGLVARGAMRRTA